MQDRANVSADFLELMRQEIIEVIKKYIDVDESAIDVRMTNRQNDDGTNGAPALYANIPILSIKDDVLREKNKEKEQETEHKEEKQGESEESKTEENSTEQEEKTDLDEKAKDEDNETSVDDAKEINEEESEEKDEPKNEEDEKDTANKD